MRNFTAPSSLLRNLCDKGPWNYAVFWKLKHEGNIILTWEDGCFNNGKTSIKVEDTQYDTPVHCEPRFISLHSIQDAEDGALANHPIKVTLEYMSKHVYSIGDGIVGKVALEKRHCWIFAGDMSHKLLLEQSEEGHLQLRAGIETILFVPVGDHGVVQLGSLNTVAEDFKVVDNIRALFSNLYRHSQSCSSRDSFVDFSSTFSPLYMPSMEKGSIVAAGLFVPHDLKHSSSVESDLFSVVDGDLQSSQHLMNDLVFDSDVRTYEDETNFSVMYNNQSLGPTEETILLHNSSNIFGSDLADFIITEKEVELNVQPIMSCSSNMKQFDSFLENLDDGGYSLSDATLCQEMDKDYNGEKTYDVVLEQEDSELFNFTLDVELQKALGSTKMEEANAYFFDMTIPKASTIINLIPFPTEGSEIIGSSFYENQSNCLKQSDGDYSLEAVVSSFQCQLHDTLPDNTSERLSSYSSERIMESCLTQSTNDFSIFEFGNFSSASHKGTSDAEGISSSLATSFKSIDRGVNAANERHCRKTDTKKLRRENGEKHRPRPRDRQLIQDRIKELRGLIPNGSDCSIDALLERTVRHMLFLRDISVRADKLRQSEDRKVKSEVCNSMKPGNYPNGASWAYELGSNPSNFPLIIENLDQPGHILIEMMCKDYGLFLEIANVIRHLDLTILKGVLESRSNKLWAHFVIEVSKDFQRTQILWPLMQLVQQNYKCG